MKSFNSFINGLNQPGDVYGSPGTIGLSRSDLPQIQTSDVPDFIQHLKDNGVSVSEDSCFPGDISFTQMELNADKINAMRDVPDNRRFVVSRDNQLLDGHHGIASKTKFNPDQPVGIYRCDCPIMDLIRLGHSFPKSFRKAVNERKN